MINDSESIGTAVRKNQRQLLVFRLEGQGYALYLSVVEKVVRAAEITPLPKAPEVVLGVINWMGRVVPVVDLRARFRFPSREIDLADRLIFARTAKRLVALLADAVDGVLSSAGEDVVAPDRIVPGLEYVEGVVKIADGLVLIHDLDKFLSLDEETMLDNALRGTIR